MFLSVNSTTLTNDFTTKTLYAAVFLAKLVLTNSSVPTGHRLATGRLLQAGQSEQRALKTQERKPLIAWPEELLHALYMYLNIYQLKPQKKIETINKAEYGHVKDQCIKRV